jgi:hypothetical protein
MNYTEEDVERVARIIDPDPWPFCDAGGSWLKDAQVSERINIAKEKARAALSSIPRQNEWQDIATAPKGRKVMAGFLNEVGNWRTIVAKYYPPKTLDWSEDCAEYDADDADEDGYAPEGWYEESETHESILPCSPTHWMPLPAPPAPKEGT